MHQDENGNYFPEAVSREQRTWIIIKFYLINLSLFDIFKSVKMYLIFNLFLNMYFLCI